MKYNRALLFPTLKEASYVFKKPFTEQNGILTFSTANTAVFIVGVGKSLSALNSFKLFQNDVARCYFLMGICGAYRNSGLNIGDVVTIFEDYFADEGVFLGEKILGTDEIGFSICEKNRVFFDIWDNLKIVNSNTVSLCSGINFYSDLLRSRTNADVETMEGASVGLAAKKFNKQIYHIRAVSNYTGDRKDQEWNFKLAMDNLSSFIYRELL
ncbi:hypothetical protein [Calditerrivibrio sp.]|jgi:futalosine hydrolase|uniref:hypothetical protein n=1 Tax=Calditerrivibrio sp. TaxID=2792612 RepID=UPI003D132DBB